MYINLQCAMTIPYKKPDLTAPRFKPKSLGFLNKPFFERFRKKYPAYADISDKQLSDIVIEFNRSLWNTAVEERNGVELPEGLGYIFLGTCQPIKKRTTLYGESIKQNMRVKIRNWESDNHLLKIFYSNYAEKYRFRNRHLWQFKGERHFTRAASAAYIKDWKKYVVVEDNITVSSLFKKHRTNQIMKALPIIIPEDYNEFEFD